MSDLTDNMRKLSVMGSRSTSPGVSKESASKVPATLYPHCAASNEHRVLACALSSEQICHMNDAVIVACPEALPARIPGKEQVSSFLQHSRRLDWVTLGVSQPSGDSCA